MQSKLCTLYTPSWQLVSQPLQQSPRMHAPADCPVLTGASADRTRRLRVCWPLHSSRHAPASHCPLVTPSQSTACIRAVLDRQKMMRDVSSLSMHSLSQSYTLTNGGVGRCHGYLEAAVAIQQSGRLTVQLHILPAHTVCCICLNKQTHSIQTNKHIILGTTLYMLYYAT